MSINDVIVTIMAIFVAVGVLDKLAFKGKYGYGDQFEEGIFAMGTLAMAMVGIMCFAPVLGDLLMPIIKPLYSLLRADPAMFAGSLLAIDMGGDPLARALTDNPEIQRLSGIYLGSMMGATIVFSIPVSLGLVEKSDKPFLAKGMLAGMISIPFGVFVAGLLDGIPPFVVLVNLVPSILLAIIFAVGLWIVPNAMMKGFNIFSTFITILITTAFAVAIIEFLTGFQLIKGMNPILPELGTVGVIAITLAGAYPLVHFITTALNKPLMALGKALGVNDKAAAGMVATLANNIPMFGLLKEMDNRGKIMAVSFSVCAAFTFGDHLGYASSQDSSLITPMIAGKLAGGLVGLFIASLIAPKVAKTKQPIPIGEVTI